MEFQDKLHRQATALIDEGNALEDQGRIDDALARYEQAQRIAPSLPRAPLNTGNVLLARGDATGALAAYERALALDTDHVGGHFNCGNALAALGRTEEAFAAWRRAGELDPAFADAWIAPAVLLENQGRLREAADAYRQAVARHPAHAPAISNLGAVLRELGFLAESVDCQRRALQIDPDLVQAWGHLGLSLVGMGRADEAVSAYRQALTREPTELDMRSSLLLSLNYGGTLTADELLAEARDFGAEVARRVQPCNAWRGAPDPERALRVGFVSGDLRQHPVGQFLVGVFEALHRRADSPIRIHAYATRASRAGDEVTARLRGLCAGWCEASGLDDAALATRIQTDAIDILIDLSGHTGHNRLPVFGWKPAPVQATWLGYLGTTGVEAVDYLIADAWTLIPAQEPYFTEKVWRLPESYLCFTQPVQVGMIGPPPALANGHITFGSFNNLAKVNAEVTALWARVLHAVPGSRLLLKARPLAEEGVRRYMEDRFATLGIDAARLLLEPLVPRAEYLKPFNRIDIALDPFPYPGITTSVECLWMGVPFVTLAGQTFMARQGVGLLNNAGLTDWIAADEEDYVRRAARHAADLQNLQHLRQTLRPRLLASPIFDAPRFAVHFEEALRGMWRRWCNGIRDIA